METLYDIFVRAIIVGAVFFAVLLVWLKSYGAAFRSGRNFKKNLLDKGGFISAALILFGISSIIIAGSFNTIADKNRYNCGNQDTNNSAGAEIPSAESSSLLRSSDTDRIKIDNFTVGNDAVSIVAALDRNYILDGSKIFVYAKYGDLVESQWTNVDSIVVAPNLTNVSLNISLPNPRPCMSFFTLVAETDSDGDGLGNFFEKEVSGTDPFSVDTDGDGWSDFAELAAGLSATNSAFPIIIVDVEQENYTAFIYIAAIPV